MKSHHDPWPAVRSLTVSCLLLLALVPRAPAQVYEKVFSFTLANEEALGGLGMRHPPAS